MTDTSTTLEKVITNPVKPFIMIAKMKALFAVLALLLVGAGLYVLADPGEPGAAAQKDPYTLDIQSRTQKVENAVLGVIDTQGKEPAYKFQTTCEDALFLIRKQNLEAEQENLKLTPEQRALNVKYRAFLQEAANVVLGYSQGQAPDLSKMNTAKAELF